MLELEQAHLMPMVSPFDGYIEEPGRVSSTCLVTVARNGEHAVLVGEPVAREFVRVAKERFAVAPSDLSVALEVLRRQTAVAAAQSKGKRADIPDPDDAPIIARALAAGAELFVTGDKRLRALEAIDGHAHRPAAGVLGAAFPYLRRPPRRYRARAHVASTAAQLARALVARRPLAPVHVVSKSSRRIGFCCGATFDVL